MTVAEKQLMLFDTGSGFIVAESLKAARKIYRDYHGESAYPGSIKHIQELMIGWPDEEPQVWNAQRVIDSVQVGFHWYQEV